MFQLAVAPGRQGFIACTPAGMLHLALSTFVSTVGRAAGEMIPTRGFVEVSPRATVIAALIVREQPANRQARQDALFTALNSGDPALTALVAAAVTVYQPLQTAGIDVNFDAAAGESGVGGPSGGAAILGVVLMAAPQGPSAMGLRHLLYRTPSARLPYRWKGSPSSPRCCRTSLPMDR